MISQDEARSTLVIGGVFMVEDEWTIPGNGTNTETTSLYAKGFLVKIVDMACNVLKHPLDHTSLSSVIIYKRCKLTGYDGYVVEDASHAMEWDTFRKYFRTFSEGELTRPTFDYLRAKDIETRQFMGQALKMKNEYILQAKDLFQNTNTPFEDDSVFPEQPNFQDYTPETLAKEIITCVKESWYPYQKLEKNFEENLINIFYRAWPNLLR